MPRANASDDSSDRLKTIPVLSRQVTRLYEMFWPVVDLINMGKEIRLMSVEEKEEFKAEMSSDEKRIYRVLKKLLYEEPSLIEKVMNAPREHIGALTRDLKKMLSTGQSNGRSEDMSKVGREMPGWKAMAWNPPLPEKHMRGMFHIQCAELLAPIQYDWTDPK